MPSQRFELRADDDFRRCLDELAAAMRCSSSSAIRRLVFAEYRRRFPGRLEMQQRVPSAAPKSDPGLDPVTLLRAAGIAI